VSRYQKGKTNLDFTGARDSEWQWHQLGRMQVCTLLQTDNHTSTPPLCSLQAGCPSCRPTNSVKALRQPMNHILNAGGGTPTGKGYFEEEIWYSCPAVDILKVTHKAQQEVAMRPSRRRYLGIFLPTLIRARQWHTQDFI